MSIRKFVGLGVCAAMMAAVAICGCAPAVVSVKSNVSDSYGADVDRIFLVLNTREIDEMTQEVRYEHAEFGLGDADTLCFGRQFLQEVAAGFDAIGVAYELYRNTQVDLDVEECVGRARRFEADEVVWVEEDFIGITRNDKTFTLVPFEEVTEITLGAYIRSEAQKDDFVWRASIEVERGSGDWTHMAHTSASTLVERLLADGIVDKGSSR